MIFFSLLLFFLFLFENMSYFFHCVICDLIFNDEDAFNRHERTRNPAPTIHTAVQCSARVVCQRRDGKLKVKGRLKNIVTLFLLMFHLGSINTIVSIITAQFVETGTS